MLEQIQISRRKDTLVKAMNIGKNRNNNSETKKKKYIQNRPKSKPEVNQNGYLTRQQTAWCSKHGSNKKTKMT